MKTVDLRTPLRSSPAALWRVLLDFGAYAEWNPLYTVEPLVRPEPGRALAAGDRLRLRAADPDDPARRISFKVEVLEHVPERSLAWRGGVPGILLGVHHFRLVEEGGGWVLLHGETFTGLYPRFFMARKIRSFERAYREVSEALVARAARGS